MVLGNFYIVAVGGVGGDYGLLAGNFSSGAIKSTVVNSVAGTGNFGVAARIRTIIACIDTINRESEMILDRYSDIGGGGLRILSKGDFG